ncbi:TetR/AcrR family transcriptional regulator [Cellulomonas aerilata]|uniref:TetR family transcriptional regulator n=1 Tax=Cellulomonas aerilata TaxID=515326 RepID=A0A512DEP2_9CELL|nr:TetR/AcrR family transcriptional regulator [Cellulomonas aerilata]GEO34931.1 TetR family transcriptional regulator [Cellulomonas aerilata]
MTPTPTARSTADARRADVVACALTVFARRGYHGTPVTAVADAAGISQAYVFRLFPTKTALFVAALELCYTQLRAELTAAASGARDGSPAQVLEAMGDAYARLVDERDLLMLQVHAQSASDVPEVRAAVRRGYGSVVEHARALAAGDDAGVRRFLALGQLYHLVVAADLAGVEEDWARVLTPGVLTGAVDAGLSTPDRGGVPA